MYLHMSKIWAIDPVDIRTVTNPTLADNFVAISFFNGSAKVRLQPDKMIVNFQNATQKDRPLIENSLLAIANALAGHVPPTRWNACHLSFNSELILKDGADARNKILESFVPSTGRRINLEPSMNIWHGHRADVLIDDWLCEIDIGQRWQEVGSLWLRASISPFSGQTQGDSDASTRVQVLFQVLQKAVEMVLSSLDLAPDTSGES